MHTWGWWLLGVIYLVLLITLGVITFRKGHWILGLIGFFFPILWIIGAVLPSKRCLLYTSPSPRDRTRSRMPSSA